jgi:excisionase family DNA binding protein
VDTEWISTTEAARRMGLTPRTIYRLIDGGDLPAYRFGRLIRIREVDLVQFIERCRIAPGQLDK